MPNLPHATDCLEPAEDSLGPWPHLDNRIAGTSLPPRPARDRLRPRRTISYGYDAAGNRTSVTSPGGITGYEYNALGQLWKVHHAGGGTTLYEYDRVGNRRLVTRPNGVRTTLEYDESHRLREVRNHGSGLPSFTYSLDGAGRRLGMTQHSGASALHTTYTYDEAGRLTGETGPNGTIVYDYDEVGNRESMSVNGVETLYGYDDNDRMLTVGNISSGYISYGYDANGNVTSAGGQTLAYDFENRLVSVVSPAGGVSYGYDASGNRVAKSSGGATTTYLVDVNLPYAQVRDEWENGAHAARYDFGDELVRMDLSGVGYYYIYDGLGSTRAVTGAAGQVVDAYDYDAYGKPIAGGTGVANSFLFNGQQYDAETGLYYLRARYYSPGTGRFLTQDPFEGYVQNPITRHRYLYANADPVNFIDPSGEVSLNNVALGLAITGLMAGYANNVFAPPLHYLGSRRSASEAENFHFPEVGNHLRLVLSNVRNDFIKAAPDVKKEVARALTDWTGGALGAWDILQLSNAHKPDVNASWIESAAEPSLPSGSTQMRFVRVNGETFRAYSVNYAIFGLAMRLTGRSWDETFSWIYAAGYRFTAFPDPYPVGQKDTLAKMLWAQAGYNYWHLGATGTPKSSVRSAGESRRTFSGNFDYHLAALNGPSRD